MSDMSCYTKFGQVDIAISHKRTAGENEMTPEEIIEKIYIEAKPQVMRSLQRRLYKAPLDDLEDIFLESTHVLYSKYLANGDVAYYERAVRVLCGIANINLKRYKERQADLAVLLNNNHGDGYLDQDSRMSIMLSDVKVHPPSYYYHRDKDRERDKSPIRQAARRKNYKRWYSTIKNNPDKYAQLLSKKNASKRRVRLERKLGIFKDRRIGKDRSASGGSD